MFPGTPQRPPATRGRPLRLREALDALLRLDPNDEFEDAAREDAARAGREVLWVRCLGENDLLPANEFRCPAFLLSR